MLWPAESIFEGTWASGPAPDELVDFELMHEFGWTWDELQNTPAYMRAVTWDLLNAKRHAQNEANRRANGG